MLFVLLFLSQSDMYSIGVLALELFQPFGTEMERVRTLGDLREGKIPDSFCQRWPVLTTYIMKLTNKEPGVRPTASELLQSELFCSKDIVCGDKWMFLALKITSWWLLCHKKMKRIIWLFLLYVGLHCMCHQKPCSLLPPGRLAVPNNNYQPILRLFFLFSGHPWFAEKGWRAGGRDHAAKETDQSASELGSHS